MKLFSSLPVLALALFLSRPLAADPQCEGFFGAFTVEPLYSAKKISDADNQRIDAVLADTKLTEKERFKKAFDIYIESRVNELPEGLRAQVRAEIAKFPIEFNSRGELEATAGHLNIPHGLRDELIFFAMKAHEIEHNIQFFVKEHDYKTKIGAAGFLFRLVFFAKPTFKFEWGSMRAEWEFLHRFPPEMRAKAIKAVRENVSSPRLRADLERMLSLAHLPLEDYLAAHHRAGRYSYDDTVGTAMQRQFLLATALGFLGMGASCGGMIGTSILCPVKNPPTSEVLLSFCRVLPWFKH